MPGNKKVIDKKHNKGKFRWFVWLQYPKGHLGWPSCRWQYGDYASHSHQNCWDNWNGINTALTDGSFKNSKSIPERLMQISMWIDANM